MDGVVPQWVRESKPRDPAVIEWLAGLAQDHVLKYLRRQSLPRSLEVTDIVHETLLRVVGVIRSLPPDLRVIPYMVRVARSVLADSFRKQRRQDRMVSVRRRAPANFEESASVLEHAELIEGCLARLDGKQKKLFTWLEIDGLTLPECAKLRGCSEASCLRARARLFHTLRMRLPRNSFLLIPLFLAISALGLVSLPVGMEEAAHIACELFSCSMTAG